MEDMKNKTAAEAAGEASEMSQTGQQAPEMSRIEQQFAFCELIDKEKFIKRQTPLTDGVPRENDSEHAWHMAVMALILAEYSNEKIDLLRTIAMILVHDLVEIYSGDTYCYDEELKRSQKARELEAADKLFVQLPEDQAAYFRGLWDEFEAYETPEAKFARALDNCQPMMLNAATDGISWVEHGVHLEQILRRNERTEEGSAMIWQHMKSHFLFPNVEKGRVRTD